MASELSKTEQAMQTTADAPASSPTLDKHKIPARRKQLECKVVQFTQEVLCPVDESGKPIKAQRSEDNIDFNVGHAILHLRNGQDLKINCNDWLIIYENGSFEVVKEGDFETNWEPKSAPEFLRAVGDKIPVSNDIQNVNEGKVSIPKPENKPKSLEEILAAAKGGKS